MIRILGLRVDQVNMEQALARLSEAIAAFRAGKSRGAQVVTINPEGIWLARGDEQLRRIIEEAYLVTPDGSGVLWAAARQGKILDERVTGIDLLYRLCERAAEEQWRVYLLGAKPGIADEAAARLRLAYPHLLIVGRENGYFRDREEQVICEIAASRPDILFAALGMPYQEKWLAANIEKLGCAVMIGVGGSFDVIAGRVRRAPRLLQRLRLEWLWRLLHDPRRWRRFLAIPRFMAAVRREIKNNNEK
ncbi:MAG: WecB/TagA/CpsF family glycosyltransferase [Clostridia bacterium]|nr:WecB/TagA/CpsF family glycosyltransferase [Clostridia bacterium]